MILINDVFYVFSTVMAECWNNAVGPLLSCESLLLGTNSWGRHNRSMTSAIMSGVFIVFFLIATVKGRIYGWFSRFSWQRYKHSPEKTNFFFILYRTCHSIAMHNIIPNHRWANKRVTLTFQISPCYPAVWRGLLKCIDWFIMINPLHNHHQSMDQSWLCNKNA